MNASDLYSRTLPRARVGNHRALFTALLTILIAVSSGIATFLTGQHLIVHSQQAAAPSAGTTQPAPETWMIEGALSETCTCSVPCTCNFGEGPSPHDYCHPFYSYDIRKGRYRDVKLDGLRFGAADLESGRTIFIDERANEKQREALRVIAARVIERAKPEEAEAEAKEMAKDVRYVTIKQEYDGRRNRLEVAGIGEFSADYIMGLDKTQPLIVRNNTTWRIRDAIKAKTSIYRVNVGKDSINTKDTNSNQGDYQYSDKIDFGAPAKWNCGACANEHGQHGKGEAMCGR